MKVHACLRPLMRAIHHRGELGHLWRRQNQFGSFLGELGDSAGLQDGGRKVALLLLLNLLPVSLPLALLLLAAAHRQFPF